MHCEPDSPASDRPRPRGRAGRRRHGFARARRDRWWTANPEGEHIARL